MARLLYGTGASAPAVESIQRALWLEKIDGVYGHQTTASVARFQHIAGLPVTGQTDTVTWRTLVRRPPPSLFERVLALTAAFEGHGFSIAAGNFDGAGITWGIIGFTLASGSLGRVIARTAERDPQALQRAFGALAPELLRGVSLERPERLEWARSLSDQGGLPHPWRLAFRRLGMEPAARESQLHFARADYFAPALATARALGFTEELGLSLCFDVQVQNGGPKPAARAELMASPLTGLARRELLAHLAASTATARWREDVAVRKLAIARGAGAVHGRHYELANWGLAELPVDTAENRVPVPGEPTAG